MNLCPTGDVVSLLDVLRLGVSDQPPRPCSRILIIASRGDAVDEGRDIPNRILHKTRATTWQVMEHLGCWQRQCVEVNHVQIGSFAHFDCSSVLKSV